MIQAKVTVKVPPDLRLLDEPIIKRAKQAVQQAAFDLEAQLKASILTGRKTGRVYRVRRGLHRASAPGEAPASNTGTLAASIGPPRFENGGLTAIIGVGAAYGELLEVGTSNIAPRPFAEPAIDAITPALETALNQLI